jgi:superfamily II DNA or RNA helicase
MIRRFSSRRGPLAGILTNDLVGAKRYDRIAGYFTSSVLEVAGEAIDKMDENAVARVVCNSSLDPLDVRTARAAKLAMYQEWCACLPADLTPALRQRLEQLYRLLSQKRLQVRVLPDSTFGLIHGKAGRITRADGTDTCFMGSTNESKSAWKLNYELVWSDDSPESVAWVQEEFDALWGSKDAFELADSVIEDVERLTRRRVIATVEDWRGEPSPDPASPIVELPVYRRESGLWAHQKYFIKRAFEAHKAHGARFVLADQVGLGKTVQLALGAKLMSLWGGGRVLVLVPKPLMLQWQEELRDLINLPTACWNGRQWVDELGNAYPQRGLDDLRRCPRRVGIVSTGLVVHGNQAGDILSSMDYECVILDEAHRARRRNIGPTHRNERANPNNLLRFLQNIAPKTRSLLLATATPVQLDPIEAWDLLEAINRGSSEHVLGTRFSQWRVRPRDGLGFVLGQHDAPDDIHQTWDWVRDPLPPATEDLDFKLIRDRLAMQDTDVAARPEAWEELGPPERARVQGMKGSFSRDHNPFIRHIVRRTREYLEETVDPQTNEPYLDPVRVRLFGERDEEAISLPVYLEDAYKAAEDFCDLIGQRPGMSAGFLRTILLRRVGSTIHAGQRTALKMLGGTEESDEADDEAEEATGQSARSALQPLSLAEKEALEKFLGLLEAAEEDPKGREVERILLYGDQGTKPWLDEGCIIFSQYYDSVRWLATRLSNLLPNETIGVYAGADKSGVYRAGEFTRLKRDDIKAAVKKDELRLVIGTDAASEGLNLQRLGTLINLDLPWNPTRLEQRKGRIQRIGQVRDEVFVYNMRYRGSVEDRVHQLLSQRLLSIQNLFGQLPDTLEDVWVYVAQRDQAKAREVIDAVPEVHPFALRYDRIEPVDWESCADVLDTDAVGQFFLIGW